MEDIMNIILKNTKIIKKGEYYGEYG